MKKIYTLLMAAFSCLFAFANHVDQQTAMMAGKNYLLGVQGRNLQDVQAGLQLAYTFSSKASGNNFAGTPTVYFYVFNLQHGKGFVIIAGDDDVTPVLGYSTESNFNPSNIPLNAQKWFEGYKREMQYLLAKHIKASAAVQQLWSKLKAGPQSPVSSFAQTVNPLVQTQWNQSPYYNDLCPGGSVTGCVATATAQVMKYWNYPATGSGFHSYNHKVYGTLSANFGSTAYQWASMPNSLAGANNAVATLMYQVGVSVDMDYSPNESSAYVITSASPDTNCAEYALKTYFGYKNTLHGLQRAGYTDAQWLSLVKAELDAGRPIIYAGFGSGGGHCFVADGYDANNYVHFNWGWGGYYDGFFQINALNPGGVGTGGGTGGFNSGHQAVMGIEPPSGNAQTFDLKLYNTVAPSAATIAYGAAFTVSTNIGNYGTGAFSGDYCAAVFDNANNFINYVEIKTGVNLAANSHYVNNIVFSSAGQFGMLPGIYKIGIFSRATGGNWIALANNGTYVNFVQMNVVNYNNIELYSNMSVSPGTTLTDGNTVSVNSDIANIGTTTFTGQYSVNLYNLDGSFAQAIGTYNETKGLPANSHYLSPYITFGAATVTVAPGTYLLAMIHQPTGGAFQLTGSNLYQNPIKVTVQQAAIQPDIYEPDDSLPIAYTLPVTYTNNAATPGTAGSNFHTGTDYDYYKVVLPAGYNYKVVPRLNDINNSGDGNTYTGDGIFSFSTDGGSTWSDTYDDVFPDTVRLNGGGTIIYHVAPSFAGATGTYLLNMKITRQAVVSNAPVITSFSPTSAGPGVTITIKGKKFTGATAVAFGGTSAASFLVKSDTVITAVVGTGLTGSVTVTTPNGTANAAGFTFITPKPNLGKDTTVKVCLGTYISIRKLYDTTGYTTVQWSVTRPDSVTVGNYTLMVSNSYGRRDTANITVAANPKPNLGKDTTVTIITGTTISIRNLYNTTGYSSVTFSTPKPDSAAKGTYKLIVTNATGCKDTAVITVLAPAPPVTPTFTVSGPTGICTGDTTWLVASNYTDTTLKIQWLRNDTAIAGAVNKTYGVVKAGSYKLKYTNKNSLSSTSAAQAITVIGTKPPKPAVTKTGKTSFCLGDSLVLTTNAIGKLQWLRNSSPLKPDTLYRYVVKIAGVYKLRVTGSGGCSNLSDSVPVVVTQVPRPVITLVNDTLVSSAASGNQWFEGGATITGATGKKYHPSEADAYTVQATIGGCKSPVSDPYIYTANTLMHKYTGSGSIKATVFPNPATNVAYLQISGNSGRVLVSLTDAAGKVLFRTITVTNNTITIPAETLASGMYFINLTDGKDSKTFKLIKAK